MKLGVLTVRQLEKIEGLEQRQQPKAIDLFLTRGTVSSEPDARTIIVQVEDRTLSVRVNAVELTFGARPLLICGSCERSTTFLLLYPDAAVCRQCVRHLEIERGLPRTAKAEMDSAAAFAVGRIAAAGEPPQASREQRRRDRQSARDNDILGTVNGLALGRGAFQDHLVLKYMDDDGLPDEGRACRYVRPSTTAAIGSAPSLDVEVLHTRMFKEGRVISRRLGWPETQTAGHTLLLIADWRDPDPLLMVAHDDWSREDARWQRITISQIANRQWRFICPVDGSRRMTLYLRNGWFASWSAQRLLHPSQRAGPRRPKEPSDA